MKPCTPTETEALLESARDALDLCLDALAGFRALPRIQGDYAALSAGEYAQAKGEEALERINDALRPWYGGAA